MHSNSFSINRIYHFILRQLSLSIYPALIAYGAIFGVLLIISLLTAYFASEDIYNLFGLYLTVFMLGGYIFTSRIFSELHVPQQSYAYLTLPVSTSEKVVGSWLLSSVFYVVVYALMMLVLSLISGLVAQRPDFIAHVFGKTFLIIIGVYLVTQTIFFLGAIYFRKNNFLKTILAMFLVLITISAVTALLGWLIVGDIMNHNMNENDLSFEPGETVLDVIQALFWYAFGPFMLIVSYFRLKERQV